MTEIIVAAITGGLALIGVIITNYSSNKKITDTLNTSQAVTNEKIDNLERSVEKHNQIIERFYKLEGQMEEVQHDIRDLKTK